MSQNAETVASNDENSPDVYSNNSVRSVTRGGSVHEEATIIPAVKSLLPSQTPNESQKEVLLYLAMDTGSLCR